MSRSAPLRAVSGRLTTAGVGMWAAQTAAVAATAVEGATKGEWQLDALSQPRPLE